MAMIEIIVLALVLTVALLATEALTRWHKPGPPR